MDEKVIVLRGGKAYILSRMYFRIVSFFLLAAAIFSGICFSDELPERIRGMDAKYRERIRTVCAPLIASHVTEMKGLQMKCIEMSDFETAKAIQAYCEALKNNPEPAAGEEGGVSPMSYFMKGAWVSPNLWSHYIHPQLYMYAHDSKKRWTKTLGKVDMNLSNPEVLVLEGGERVWAFVDPTTLVQYTASNKAVDLMLFKMAESTQGSTLADQFQKARAMYKTRYVRACNADTVKYVNYLGKVLRDVLEAGEIDTAEKLRRYINTLSSGGPVSDAHSSVGADLAGVWQEEGGKHWMYSLKNKKQLETWDPGNIRVRKFLSYRSSSPSGHVHTFAGDGDELVYMVRVGERLYALSPTNKSRYPILKKVAVP